jgi:hypothetical protein
MSEIPIRFSADPEDSVFGFRHDSLLSADGTQRNWALLAKNCMLETATRATLGGPSPSKLVCLYANVEYLTQLKILLAYARLMLDTGEKEELAIRLFAIFPVGPTKAALDQSSITASGGEILTLHGHSCYDFLPYRHWLGKTHSNAEFSNAAPIQVGLVQWQTSTADISHPLTERECSAVREWALASCLRNPTLPTPKSITDDPSPNLSFHKDLSTPDMILHARLNMYHLPPLKQKKAAPEQVPEDTSASGNEEESTPAARAPLEIIEVRNKYWPPVPTVTEYLYGPLMPTTTSREWHDVRMHFSGSIPHSLQEGLSFNGLSRAEVADTLNLLSRSRIRTGAAAWHAHGK